MTESINFYIDHAQTNCKDVICSIYGGMLPHGMTLKQKFFNIINVVQDIKKVIFFGTRIVIDDDVRLAFNFQNAGHLNDAK